MLYISEDQLVYFNANVQYMSIKDGPLAPSVLGSYNGAILSILRFHQILTIEHC